MISWRDLKGNGGRLVDVLFWHLPLGAVKGFVSLSVPLVPAEIRRSHLPNTGLEHDSFMYRVSAVHVGTKIRAGQPRNLSSIPCICLKFICYPKDPANLLCLPSLPFIEDRKSVSGCKVAGTWCLEFTLLVLKLRMIGGIRPISRTPAWRP